MLVSVPDPVALLAATVEAVREAGSTLAREFHRPGGPRGHGDKAEVDVEIEALLRDRLRAAWPARFVGEELGVQPGDRPGWCWVVDPHDGTRDFLLGLRGSAVSVALLHDGRPVLGVVHAPLPPDRGSDLIAWAEGAGSVRRNGIPVRASLAGRRLDADAHVLMSSSAAERAAECAALAAPARFVALTSIAYRLARVAAGDAVATLTLHGAETWDVAGGHALLLAAGGDLFDAGGRPFRYEPDGIGRIDACFAGAPEVAQALAARNAAWHAAATVPKGAARVPHGGPRADDLRHDRAAGSLMGLLAGDALGSLVEFRDARDIAACHPQGVRDFTDGGTWDTLAGQPTDDGELALALARTLAGPHAFELERVADAYARWHASGPFDVGRTTSIALRAACAASPGSRASAARAAGDIASEANGSLMRIAPVGIALAGDPAGAALRAREDSAVTHPSPICLEACAAFAAAVATGVAGAGVDSMLAQARAVLAGRGPAGDTVRSWIDAAAADHPVGDPMRQMGWVRIALHNAFRHLVHTANVETAIVATVAAGGDTDTNAAIAGALLGARDGRDGLPARWRLSLQSCRPLAERGARRPRPSEYWPDDACRLAEALVARSSG